MRTHATTPMRSGAPVAAVPEDSGSALDALDIRTAPIPVGVPVEVRNRFDERWTHGFSVAVVREGAYQLRRLSDGSILPAWFPASMIRPDPAG